MSFLLAKAVGSHLIPKTGTGLKGSLSLAGGRHWSNRTPRLAVFSVENHVVESHTLVDGRDLVFIGSTAT